MWYIKIDTLFIILAFSILYTLSGIILKKKFNSFNLAPYLIVFDLFLLGYVSKSLALFYVIYTVITYLFVLILEKIEKCRKYLFVVFCILCILPLIYMRMTKFTDVLPHFIVLIGFAFNMLKAIDALFYVYYGKKHIKFIPYANFLLFFPVITAGPIFRYRDFMACYENPQYPDMDKALWCGKRFVVGLFKKLVIMPWLLWLLHYLLPQTGNFGISFMIVFVCYALLHVDFSGYSDMAIATGTFVGIKVPENFDKPIKSATFTQFWHRWHITLGDWLREHVFVSIADKRLNKYQMALVAFTILFLMGAWRGFTLLDISRGIYLGILIAIENLISKTTFNKNAHSKFVYCLRCFIIAFLFSIGAITFFLNETQVVSVLKGFLP